MEYNNDKNEKRILSDNKTIDAYNIRYGEYISHSVFGASAATAANYGIFFTARHPIEVMRVTETHAVAGNDAGAVTLDVKKAGSGVAIASGTTILGSTFSLKSTANTPISKESVNLSSARVLKEGDRLGLVTSGTLTNLSDVCVTIYYKNINQGYIR